MLGIKDTDDAIVSATLRALADLVVHLGSSTVIGGTRLKLFTNGAPKSPTGKRPPSLTSYIPLTCKRIEVRRDSLEVALSSTMNIDDNRVNPLPERHDPDGGEDATTCPTSNPERASPSVVDDFEGEWSDWEAEEVSQPEAIQAEDVQAEDVQAGEVQAENVQAEDIQLDSTQLDDIESKATESQTIEPEVLQPEFVAIPVSSPLKKAMPAKKVSTVIKNDFDLSMLDIQVKVKPDVVEEIDYFADMQPTITKSVYVEPQPTTERQASETPRLNFSIQLEEEASDGWNWEED